MRRIVGKMLMGSLGLLFLSPWAAPGAYAQQPNQAAAKKHESGASTDWYVDRANDELARYRERVLNALTHARELKDENCYDTARGLLRNMGVAENILQAYENDPAGYVAKWDKTHPADPATTHSMAEYIANQVVGNSSQEGLSVLQSAGCK
jgi:hypothetical protein